MRARPDHSRPLTRAESHRGLANADANLVAHDAVQVKHCVRVGVGQARAPIGGPGDVQQGGDA